MKECKVKVLENAPLAAGIYRMRFSIPGGVEGLQCGKFVNISVGDGAHLLRRPIALCEYDEKSVTICYQLKGEGTRAMSRAQAGDELTCVLPLGNGFHIEEGQRRVALIGGGVGVFPMVSVLHAYKGAHKDFYSYIGFRGKNAVCMENAFASQSIRSVIVTDDGSYGYQGNAVQAFLDDYANAAPDVILACGPTPMLRALKAGLEENGITVPCYVSLEERMGCGIGACLVCTCKKSDGSRARVCKDGPVFPIGEVDLHG